MKAREKWGKINYYIPEGLIFMKFSQKLILWWIKRPGFSLTITFILLILVGAILLTLPISAADGIRVSFVDSLFTSASAACVTGLSVVDAGAVFSRFGHWVIMLLIQFGALNIIIASVFFLLLFGRRISLANQVSAKNIFDVDFVHQAVKLAYFAVISALVAEAIGTAALFFGWRHDFSSGWTALFYSLFHSISAFGNAGFSLFSDNLMAYRGNIWINLVICLLIVAGGLGFIVLKNLRDFFLSVWKKGREIIKLSLHAKIVLVATVILIVSGAVFFYSIEHFYSWADFSPKDAVLSSFFQSVTARTAGFSTVDIGAMSTPSQLFLMLLMFIGGAPGSAAGGVKVTTAAILLILFVSVIRGKENCVVGRRRIAEDSVQKATTLVVASALIIFIFCLTLSFLEKFPLKEILFETVSAFGTVGLSCGITPFLSVPGKLLISLLMLIGRIGPLNLVLLLVRRQGTPKINYPTGKVLIG